MGSQVIDEPEIRRWRAAYRAALDGVPGDCPPPETLWSAARGRGSARERRAVVDHLGRCPACGEAWRIAVALAAGDARLLPWREPQRAAPDRGRRAVWPWAAAALVALALGLAPRLLRQGEATLRERPRAELSSRLDERRPLSRGALALAWSGSPPGGVCRLRVADAALRPVFEASGLRDEAVAVPATALAEVMPGALLYWQVECESPDHGHVASRTFRVRLAD
jgi:hypothetical protein